MDVSSVALALISLLAVLGLIVGAQFLLRGRLAALLPQGGARDQHLAAVRVLALDSRRRLHLVACEGRHVLLLTGGGHDLVVGWLPPAPDGDAP